MLSIAKKKLCFAITIGKDLSAKKNVLLLSTISAHTKGVVQEERVWKHNKTSSEDIL